MWLLKHGLQIDEDRKGKKVILISLQDLSYTEPPILIKGEPRDLPIPKTKPASSTTSSTTSLSTTPLSLREFLYENGASYIGESREPDVRHGKGKLVLSRNPLVSYEGSFSNNLYEGYGILRTEDIVYEGYFIQGKKNGLGKLTNKKTKVVYEGEWVNDIKEGNGKEIYSDGSVYIGNFTNNKKNSQGKLYLANGSVYEGEFLNDKINGEGVLRYCDNRVCYGTWKDNVLTGFGKLVCNENVYLGYFNNDRKNGLGINYFNKTKSVILGTWVDDMLEGLAIFASEDGQIKCWIMKKGKVERECCESDIMVTNECSRLKEFYKCLEEGGEIRNYPKIFYE